MAAFQTTVAIFPGLGGDPLKSNLVECTKSGDSECETTLGESYGAAFCALPRETWKWKSKGYSLVSEFDLVCDQEWLLYMASATFFIGTLAGCVLWQLMSESISRRRLLYFGCVVTGIAGSMAATAPFLWLFILFRAISGAGVGGIGVSSFVLAADITGPSWRPFTGLFLQGGFSSGAALATLMAWAVPGWRWYTLLCALLPLALTATTWSLMVESPQWLLERGRKGEATAALAAIAFTNHTRPPEYPLADPTALLANPHRATVDVIRSARLRQRVLLLSAAWFVAGVAYYTSALLPDALSASSLGGEGSALELAFTGFAYELPGVAAAALAAERLGRKTAVLGGLGEAGAALLASGVTRGNLQRTFAVAARFGLAAGSSALYLLSWELFPVVVQLPGMGLVNQAGRAGAIAAPWLAFAAAKLHSGLVPLAVSGSLCFGAALLISLLPETLGLPIPETIQDMNAGAVKRHRSWTHSLRNVFYKPGVASIGFGAPPSGSVTSVSLETVRSV